MGREGGREGSVSPGGERGARRERGSEGRKRDCGGWVGDNRWECHVIIQAKAMHWVDLTCILLPICILLLTCFEALGGPCARPRNARLDMEEDGQKGGGEQRRWRRQCVQEVAKSGCYSCVTEEFERYDANSANAYILGLFSLRFSLLRCSVVRHCDTVGVSKKE